jgi:hypothetical protein
MQMEFKWLTYANSPKRHAFPVDEKSYGDWALCGRGSGSRKVEGEQPLCGKCQEILERFSERELEMNRLVRAGETDFNQRKAV